MSTDRESGRGNKRGLFVCPSFAIKINSISIELRLKLFGAFLGFSLATARPTYEVSPRAAPPVCGRRLFGFCACSELWQGSGSWLLERDSVFIRRHEVSCTRIGSCQAREGPWPFPVTKLARSHRCEQRPPAAPARSPLWLSTRRFKGNGAGGEAPTSTGRRAGALASEGCCSWF
jgi:hypothetical protein